MKQSKVRIVFAIVPLLLSVAIVGIIISMSNIDKQTDDTTKFYTATVTDVNITDTGKNIFAEIHTKEYNTSLHISTNICKNISIDDVKELRDGQTIFFGIENIKVKQMNKVKFVNITSLRTETKNVFSLEEYNSYISNSAYPARIASIIMASLLFFISLFCYFRINRLHFNQSR